jgi:pimeloyl-ACP methyl ester carboxylesterase
MAEESIAQTDAEFGRFRGYRAAQAKGVLCRGRFVSSGEGARLTRAAHLQTGANTPVTVRFSNSSTDPTRPDGAIDVRSMSVAFHLRGGERTDVLALMMPRFFVGTADQFLRWQRGMGHLPVFGVPWPRLRMGVYILLRRLPPLILLHQAASLSRVPSYATCRYNSLHAFKWFTDIGECFVRYSWVPEAGEKRFHWWQPRWWRAPRRDPDYLRAELERRLARGPVRFKLVVQMAAGDDRVDDASAKWPKKRRRVEVGTLEIKEMGCWRAIGPEPVCFEPTRMTDGIEVPERDSLLALRRHVYALSAKRRGGVERPPDGGRPPAHQPDGSKTVSVGGGIDICYERFGPRQGRKLVLIMGFACPQTWWQPSFYELFTKRGYEVIRFDNRDCGRSTHLDVDVGKLSLLFARWRKPYSVNHMADDLNGLLDRIGVPAAHVVGISMGGMIAQALAIEHPERVLSMTCISSAPSFRLRPPWPLRRIRVFLRLNKKPPEDEDANVDFSVPLWRLLNGGHYLFEEDNVRKLLHTAYRWSGGPDPKADLRQMIAVKGSGDRTKELGNLAVPALVIHGTKDPLIPFKRGRALAMAIPNAGWSTIKGMGHYTPKETWQRIVNEVDALASDAEPPP